MLEFSPLIISFGDYWSLQAFGYYVLNAETVNYIIQTVGIIAGFYGLIRICRISKWLCRIGENGISISFFHCMASFPRKWLLVFAAIISLFLVFEEEVDLFYNFL